MAFVPLEGGDCFERVEKNIFLERSFTVTGHLPEASCDGQLVRGGPVQLHDTEAGPRAAWRRRRRRLLGVEHPPQCGVF